MFQLWTLTYRTSCLSLYLLPPYATFICFFLAGLFAFDTFFFIAFSFLFVVEKKILKNNAYSIQKLWMGEWRCQLYVHYMFWCNQKHWESVVLCCKEKKNKSISDIAVLLLKIKTSTEPPCQGACHVCPCRALCWCFLSFAVASCLLGAAPNSWLISCCLGVIMGEMLYRNRNTG